MILRTLIDFTNIDLFIYYILSAGLGHWRCLMVPGKCSLKLHRNERSKIANLNYQGLGTELISSSNLVT